MNYKKFFFLFFLLVGSCSAYNIDKAPKVFINKEKFKNSGFALVYNDKLYNNKIVSKKMDNRGLIIFQKNLKKNTIVRIKNILNNKVIVAKVGSNSKYPLFNNSVISERISKEIDLDSNEPYVEIIEVLQNSSFIAKKAKTFDEEKQVANKAPIDEISVNNLSDDSKKTNKIKKDKFNYLIKVADFYFKDTALSMLDRIKNETSINNPKFKKLSKAQYRVFIGPFDNIYSLQKAFNDISILKFENIEIIKNDKNN